MATGNGDLWEHLAQEVRAVRTDVRRVYDRLGAVSKVLSRVAAATRKRFEAQEAYLKALDERIRALELDRPAGR